MIFLYYRSCIVGIRHDSHAKLDIPGAAVEILRFARLGRHIQDRSTVAHFLPLPQLHHAARGVEQML